MRLEINAGGLDSFFQGVSSFISTGVSTANSYRLINSIQNVANKTNSVCGGVGTLGTALGYIRTRKTIEETRKTAVQAVKTKADGFIQTAIRVDTAIAGIICCSQEAFYQTNPWLRPPVPPGLWDYVCSGADRLWNGAKEVWNGIVDFVKEHWKEILIGIAAVTIGALLTVITGGAFLPALLAGLKVAAIGGLVSGGISTGISVMISIINGDDFGTVLSKAFNAFGDGFASGFMWGGIGGGASVAMRGFSTGMSVVVASKVIPALEKTALVSTGLSLFTSGLDLVATFDAIIDPSSNPISDFNSKLHSNGWYNAVQTLSNWTSALSVGSVYGIDKNVYGIYKSNKLTNVPRNNGVWEGSPTKLKWIPDDNYIPPRKKGGYNNPDNLTWGQIKKKYNFDSISFDRKGNPDLSKISVHNVKIKKFSPIRKENFFAASNKAAVKKHCSPEEISAWMKKNNYTWHEWKNMKTMQAVPNEVHGNINHTGGISVSKNN